MSIKITTKFTGGTSGDAALFVNWSNGLARNGDTQIIPRTTSRAITSNLGSKPSFETLTLTGNAANGEQVVIDSKTYTFKTAITGGDNVDGNVKVGADAEGSLDNLVAAINLASGGGSTYAANMTVHPTFYATDEAGTVIDVVARTAGTGANGSTTTETLGSGSWGSGTTSGGAATGLSPDYMLVQDGYNQDIMTSGTPAVMGTVKTRVKGDGSFYLDINNLNADIICESRNFVDAIVIQGTGDGVDRLQIISGHVVWNSTGTATTVHMTSSQSLLTINTTSITFAEIIQADGILDAKCTVTLLVKSGGSATKTNKKLITMYHSGGSIDAHTFDDDETASSAGSLWVMIGGLLDTTGGTGLTNLTELIVYPQAAVIEDDDLVTQTRRNIGE